MEMSLRNSNKPFTRPAAKRAARSAPGAAEQESLLPPERREVVRLLAQWDQFAGSGTPPSLDELRQFLGADGWNRRFLVAQDPDPASSVFITCGTGIAQVLGEAVKGRTLRDIVWDGCRPLFDGCLEAARTRLPTSIEGTLRNPVNEPFPFRAVILPFGNKRDCIPYLFGAIGWSVN